MLPKIYKSTDVGAPELHRDNAGEFNNVLRKCLVEGYGDKDPAGWTEETTVLGGGGNIAVFRNSPVNGGTGAYFRFDDSSTTSWREISFKAYSSMSDVDTGVNETLTAYTRRYAGAQGGSFTDSLMWMIICDDKTVHMTFGYDYSGKFYYDFLSFGDIFSFNQFDAFKYYVCGLSAFNINYNGMMIMTSLNVPSIASTSNSGPGLYFAQDHTGISGNVAYGVYPKTGATNQMCGGDIYAPTLPDITGNQEMIIKPIMIARDATIRGYVRGAIMPVHRICAYYPNMTKRDEPFTPGTEVYTMYGSGSSLIGKVPAGGIYVETGVEWD